MKKRRSVRKCRRCATGKPNTAEYFRCLPNGHLAITCLSCDRKMDNEKPTKHKYGLTSDEFWKYRNRCCALCGSEQRLVIDHCHKTDRVRDTLCTPCNTGLGMFKDRPEILRLAAEYVEDHAKRHYWAAKHEEFKAQAVDNSPKSTCNNS